MKFFTKLFAKLESLNFKLRDWVLVFASIVVIKMITDTLSGNSIFTMNYMEIFIHSMFVYLLTAITLMIIIIAITKEKLQKISSIGLVAVLTLPLINVIDLVLSLGKDYFRAYIFKDPAGLLHDFITFFGSNPTTGITYGMRIQTAIVCIFLAIYVFNKTNKYWKAILGGILGYVTIFVYFALPSIIASLVLYFSDKAITSQSIIAHFVVGKPLVGNFLLPRYNIFDIKFSLWLAILITIMLFVLQLVSNREKALAFFRNLRLTRVLSQTIPLLGGFAIAYSLTENKPLFDTYEWLSFAVLFIAVVWNWVFGLCLNDIHDLEIDKLSNANKWRPLPSGKMTVQEFWSIAFVSFLMSSVLSLIVDYRFFLFMTALNALVYLYSSPPLRLRRFLFVSNLVIAFHLMLVVMMGAMFLSSSPHVPGFPREILLGVFAIGFLITSIKDIKDREADAKQNIATVPTVFGDKKGKLINACMFALVYFVVPFALAEPVLFFAAAGFSVFTFLILAADKLQERLMFVVTLCYIVMVFWVVYL